MTRCLSRRRRRVNTAVRLNSGRRRAGGTFFLSMGNRDDDAESGPFARIHPLCVSASRARLSLLLLRGLSSRKTFSGETRRRAIDRGVGRRECVGNNSLHRFAAFYRVDAASMRAPRSSRPAAGSFARFAPAPAPASARRLTNRALPIAHDDDDRSECIERRMNE